MTKPDKLLQLVLLNQYRIAAVLDELLQAPGVTANPRKGVNLHDAMREMQRDVTNALDRGRLDELLRRRT